MNTKTKTTTQRGYGRKHRALRDKLAPQVRAGRVNCWRCGQRIYPNDKWDLGHDDDDRAKYRGPEHANRCNRAAAGRKAAKMRTGNLATRTVTSPDTTRRW